jgi:hypothetical protein
MKMAGSHREHHVAEGQTITASVYLLEGRFRATVIDGIPSRVKSDVTCDDEETARERADALLLEAYPHDCLSRCGGWIAHAKR